MTYRWFKEAFTRMVGFLTFFAIVGAFIYFAAVTAQQNALLSEQVNAAHRTETALCILREDLEIRAQTSRQFLIDNPDGIPGISAEALQNSIDNQERTITALALLECP